MDTDPNYIDFTSGGWIGAATVTLVPGTQLAARLFGALIESALKSNAVEVSTPFAFASELGLVWCGKFHQVKPALRSIHRVLSERRKELNADLFEIALFDVDEHYWRTVFPFPALPFDRFLSNKNLHSSLEIIHKENSEASEKIKQLKEKL